MKLLPCFSLLFRAAAQHSLRLVKTSEPMHFGEVQAYGEDGSQLAASSFSFESGYVGIAPVGNCFDGNTVSYCETQSATDALVAVYPAEIVKVVLVNRYQCCQARADGVGVEVRADGVLKFNIQLSGTRNTYTLDVMPHTVRLVKRSEDPMHFAEVTAYDRVGAQLTAASSSFESGAAVGNCFDGVTSTYCETTASTDALVAVYPMPVAKLVVVNRGDCCKSKADGVGVEVSANGELQWSSQLSGVLDSYSVYRPLNTLRIVKATDPLHLAEVMAYDRDGTQLVASSFYFESGYVGNVGSCFDGSTSNFCETTVTASTEALVAVYPAEIARVVLANRPDCCQSRAAGVGVEVRAQGELKLSSLLSGAQNTYDIDVPLSTLRLVKRSDEPMHFGEVLAFDAAGSAVVPASYSFESSLAEFQEPASKCFDGDVATFCETRNAVDSLFVAYDQEVEWLLLKNRVSCCQDRAEGVVVTLVVGSTVRTETLTGALANYDPFAPTSTTTTATSSTQSTSTLTTETSTTTTSMTSTTSSSTSSTTTHTTTSSTTTVTSSTSTSMTVSSTTSSSTSTASSSTSSSTTVTETTTTMSTSTSSTTATTTTTETSTTTTTETSTTTATATSTTTKTETTTATTTTTRTATGTTTTTASTTTSTTATDTTTTTATTITTTTATETSTTTATTTTSTSATETTSTTATTTTTRTATETSTTTATATTSTTATESTTTTLTTTTTITATETKTATMTRTSTTTATKTSSTSTATTTTKTTTTTTATKTSTKTATETTATTMTTTATATETSTITSTVTTATTATATTATDSTTATSTSTKTDITTSTPATYSTKTETATRTTRTNTNPVTSRVTTRTATTTTPARTSTFHATTSDAVMGSARLGTTDTTTSIATAVPSTTATSRTTATRTTTSRTDAVVVQLEVVGVRVANDSAVFPAVRAAVSEALEGSIWAALDSADRPARLRTTVLSTDFGLQVNTTSDPPQPIETANSLVTVLQGGKDDLASAVRRKLMESVTMQEVISSGNIAIENLQVRLQSQAPTSFKRRKEVAVLAAIESELPGLLEDLASGTWVEKTTEVAGATVTAAKLSFLPEVPPSNSSAPDADGDAEDSYASQPFLSLSMTLSGDEEPGEPAKPEAPPPPKVEVRLPLKTFAALASSIPAGEELAMVVTVPETFSNGQMGNGELKVEAAMAIDITTLTGIDVNTSKLVSPIEFTMPTFFYEGLKCNFYDEDLGDWSSNGVETPKNNIPGEGLRCRTWHLSLFGAIFQGFLDALLCSQLNLFNAQAFRELLHGHWKSSPGALLFWGLLTVLGSIFATAAYMDHRRERSSTWQPEFFLLPSSGRNAEPAYSSERSEEERASTEDFHKGFLFRFGASVAACLAVWCACCRESALRDAVDEILSEWFEQVGEVRTLVEGIWESLEFGAISAGRICHMSRSVMSRLVLTSSRRIAAASMGLNGHVVDFVLDDRDLKDLLMRRHARRAEDIRRSADARRAGLAAQPAVGPSNSERRSWRQCKSRDEAWFALHEEVCEEIEKQVSKMGWLSLPHKVWVIFMAHNPIGLVLSTNIFMSCKMMAFMRILELVGDLMVVCIFFDASGAASAKDEEEECGAGGELAESTGYKMGRILAIATGSIVFAGLPVTLLHSLHIRHFKHFDHENCPEWKKQLKTWRIQDGLVWVLGSLYLAFALLFIALFLANTSVEDHEDWTSTGGFTLVQDAVIVPLSVALVMPILCGMLITCISVGAHLNHATLVRDVHHRLHETTNVMLPIVMI